MDLSDSMWNLAFQPSYPHYHIVFGHQTCQGGDFPWEAPTHKLKCSYL